VLSLENQKEEDTNNSFDCMIVSSNLISFFFLKKL
jgi:hypothetical protein